MKELLIEVDTLYRQTVSWYNVNEFVYYINGLGTLYNPTVGLLN